MSKQPSQSPPSSGYGQRGRETTPAVRQQPPPDDVERQPGTDIIPRAAAAVNPFAPAPGVGGSAGGNALAAQSEARAIAEVQARYISARRFPRDERRACDKLINSFGRIGLAEGAEYQYSRGGSDISGLSIRAAEAIAQTWGNIDFGFSEVGRYRGDDMVMVSVVRAFAVDLETGTGPSREFHVRHWRDTKQGGYALKDERDIYELMANQAQRRVRACLLSLIPGDVQDLARKQAATTLRAKADVTPEGIAQLVAVFEPFGVTKAHIEARIQRRIDTISPGQVVTMRRIFTSLRDGMSRPGDWFEMGEPDDTPAANAVDEALAARRAAKVTGTGEAVKVPATVSGMIVEDGREPVPVKVEAGRAVNLKPGQTFVPDRPAGPTYAELMDRINKSPTLDVLGLTSDDIGAVDDEQQRAELTKAFRAKEAELEKAAPK